MSGSPPSLPHRPEETGCGSAGETGFAANLGLMVRQKRYASYQRGDLAGLHAASSVADEAPNDSGRWCWKGLACLNVRHGMAASDHRSNGRVPSCPSRISRGHSGGGDNQGLMHGLTPPRTKYSSTASIIMRLPRIGANLLQLPSKIRDLDSNMGKDDDARSAPC